MKATSIAIMALLLAIGLAMISRGSCLRMPVAGLKASYIGRKSSSARKDGSFAPLTQLMLSPQKSPSDLEGDISSVEAKIAAVEREINEVKDQIEEAARMVTISKGKMKDYWMSKEDKLRSEKDKLRSEKLLLMEKSLSTTPSEDVKWTTCKIASIVENNRNLSFDLPRTEGNIWQLVDIGVNATFDDAKVVPLYARKDTMALISFLFEQWENFKARSDRIPRRVVAFVNGPPGVGKSCIALSWVMNMAANGYADVLWLRSNAGSYLFTEELRNGTFLFMSDLVNPVNTFSEHDSKRRIVVYDGFVKGDDVDRMLRKCFQLLNGKALILACTSYQAGQFNQDTQSVMRFPAKFTADSWSFEETTKANEVLCWNRDVDEIYHFSGGSVRNFLLGTGFSKSAIDGAVNRVEDFSALFMAQLGDASRAAVNSLMYLRKHEQEVTMPFVSEYARRVIVEKVGLPFINEAERYCPDNPQWQGWVFESKVLEYLKYPQWQWLDEKSLPNGTTLNWPMRPKLMEKVRNPEDLFARRMSSSQQIMYIFPALSTQVLFDFLVIDLTNKTTRVVLYVVQITRQKRRKYKLGELERWLSAIKKKFKLRNNVLIDTQFVQISPNDMVQKVSFSSLKNEIKQNRSIFGNETEPNYFAVGVYDDLLYKRIDP